MGAGAIVMSGHPSPNALAASLLTLWFGPEGERDVLSTPKPLWFRATEADDQALRDRFLPTLGDPNAGRDWPRERARDRLARVLLFDQLPRHLFRGQARAFAYDRLARTEAAAALARGDAHAHAPAPLLFLLMPFRHSEDLATVCRLRATYARLTRRWSDHPSRSLMEDFDRSAAALERRLRRFGRDPLRNAALGRLNRPEEGEFLAKRLKRRSV
jgi:uncharacterized protein (DUF924 family)